MSQKANPTTIGLFIVIGLVLGVAGVLTFSSSRWFSSTREFILYFDSSLNGLGQGAPVKYRGVTIGSVKKVMIRFNQRVDDLAMPVLIEIEERRLRERLEDASLINPAGELEPSLRRSLRGSLEAESIVTGVLYVNLDIVPDAPPADFHQLRARYREILTQPTGIQELIRNLARLDLSGLEQKLEELMEKIDLTLNNLKVGEMSTGVTNVLATLNRIIEPLELTNTIVTVNQTLEEYKSLAANLNRRIGPLADGATNTLADASRTLEALRGSVENLRALLAPDAPLRNDLSLALEQLAGAAQSISALAQFLERHPNALLTGRARPKSP